MSTDGCNEISLNALIKNDNFDRPAAVRNYTFI